MHMFRTLSQILGALAVLLALCDLAYQWVANKLFKLRDVEELWTDAFSAEAFKKAAKPCMILACRFHF